MTFKQASLQDPTSNIFLSSHCSSPLPLGAHRLGNGVHFSIVASDIQEITLCLFRPQSSQPDIQLPLSPSQNQTGEIWHCVVEAIPYGWEYSYKVTRLEGGELCTYEILDPYARGISGRPSWGEGAEGDLPRGLIDWNLSFDWEETCSPQIPMNDLVIYELHTRGFTQDPSSGVTQPGSYLGMIEKLDHLSELGVNAIELLPIFEFNELERPKFLKDAPSDLCNYWGYSTVHFFCPMLRYSTSGRGVDAIAEFRTLVKECHRRGIEVILDVVYNHTAEWGEEGAVLHFKALAPDVYYIKSPEGHYMNYSGCGNTLNTNHPIVQDLIIDSLHHWVTEMRVDGFRFDLASIFSRDLQGHPLSSSPILDRIARDPLLANTKLIAEPWDAAGLYQVGQFHPESSRWAEWNGAYRDGVRHFVRGDAHCVSAFATRIAGSEDLYAPERKPWHSINFITAHDGFTLRDLVSYNHKKNEDNREGNRDGCNHNISWNCGVEGPTNNVGIQDLREQQMRNFLTILLCSLGVPMLHMGDEYGHTKRGNNNTWCQDNELNWFDWNELEENQDLFRFCRLLIQFRKDHPLLRQDHYLNPQFSHWFQEEGQPCDWYDGRPVLGLHMIGSECGKDLYLAINSEDKEHTFLLPPRESHCAWVRVVDTAKKAPLDFVESGESLVSNRYLVKGRSVCLYRTANTSSITSD